MIMTVGVISFAAATTDQSPGYVQYKIIVNDQENPIMSTSATVNYSVVPTGQTGFVDISLTVYSDISNFTYSRAVNASSFPEIYPYLSGLTNQSFSYQTQGVSITANLVNVGQVSVKFNGTTYQATKYQISTTAANVSMGESFSATGTVTSMPSGLINSAQLTLNQTTTINVTLLSTNLSLNAPATSINVVGASMFGAAIVAAAAIAGLAVSRRTKHKKQTGQASETGTEQKPSFGVD